MDNCVGVIINNRKLIVNKNGNIYSILKNGETKLIPNIGYKFNGGYNQIGCGGKLFMRQRIIAYTYLDLDLYDLKKCVDHIDRNKLNNSLDNLRIVTQQQNCFNRLSKGFYKSGKYFISIISLNGNKIYLGQYKTESEARNAYIAAKLIYHKIL